MWLLRKNFEVYWDQESFYFSISDIIFGFEDSNLNLLPKSVKIGSHFGDFILNLTMTLKWMNYPKALERNLLFFSQCYPHLNIGSQSYFFVKIYGISQRTEEEDKRKLVLPRSQSKKVNLAMDGTLHTDFRKFETSKYIKKYF